jgi:hypothetical protein
VSNARPLPLPPSGISVWKPLSSSESGLVAILGSGPSEGEYGSAEDVQCVWCGLRSHPAAACDVCGSPLYDSIAIWQPESSTEEPPPSPIRASPSTQVDAPSESEAQPPARSWFGFPRLLSSPTPTPAPASPARDTTFKPFRRFAGLEISWIRRLPE